VGLDGENVPMRHVVHVPSFIRDHQDSHIEPGTGDGADNA
jgi:hypothetical protein